MKQIKFKKGNKIKFLQDFSFLIGVPSDIPFNIEDYSEERLRLTSNGYGFGVPGQPDGEYGNGAIYIFKEELEQNIGQWLDIHGNVLYKDSDIKLRKFRKKGKGIRYEIDITKSRMTKTRMVRKLNKIIEVLSNATTEN